MEDVVVRHKAAKVGLGVVILMSLKGTATLTAAMLLPTWPLRILALHVIAIIGLIVFIRHRHKKKKSLHEGHEGI